MSDDSQDTRILSRDEIVNSAIVPGSILRERYRLDSEIGRGGMGIVYRATDLELHREVAVKVLPTATSSTEARQRLLREARAAAALNHPHIISVHDIGEANGAPFFVMELVQGPSLAKARPTELSRVVDIACQLCAALEHAHANSIVHRDLKPDNVLLSVSSDNGSVKLADLGLALPADGARISRAGVIVGTAAYMAPEQALGQAVDGRTDLYALGVLLYEMTTGRLPFIGDDPLSVVSQHVHASVVPPKVLRPDLPRALEAVILRLLAKDPAQRFSTAAETATALRDSLTAEEITTDEDGAGTVAILDALSRGRLVGRATELTQAIELWHHAREGHGHAVLFSGEPGAGKTRLAREVTIHASVDGAVVLSGGCYEYEATTPYLPFVEAFRRLVREEKDDAVLRAKLGDAAQQIAKLAPEIQTRLGPFPERAELPPHEERLLFFDAVVKVFVNLAGPKGLLFYADDLHWADRSTLWLLGHLLRQLREERVLILGAYRETELDRAHPLAKSLVDWNRERLVTRIALKRFDAAETSAQLGALLGESVSGDFTAAVFRETEGNPFFVEEVLKALIEKGSVRRESGRWQRCDVDQLVIPQSMKEAIGSRLDRVSQEANEVLRAGAVLGKTFTFAELQSASGEQSEDVLLDALDEAVATQLINADRSESFTFTHDKIREVLYEELNPIRRRRLHRQAAEGLERTHTTAHYAVEKLAHHYIQAGDYERGLNYAKQAAAEAERVFAFDEAIAAYGRARDCAEALGLIDEQLAQEEAMGKSYLLHGDLIPASEHFEHALALTTEPAVRARLQCQAAASLVATGNPRGLEHIREALEVLNAETNPLETANALSIEGRFHHLAGRHGKAIELLERAATLVAPTAAADNISTFAASAISQIYAYLAGGYQHSGLYDNADRWARRTIEFGVAHNILFAQAIGYEFLGEDSVHKGEYQKGLEYAAHELEIVEKLHSRERRAWTYLVSSLSSLHGGDLETAEKEFTEGIALAESVGEVRVAALMKGNYAVLQALRGRFDEALQTALENFEQAEASGLLYSRFEGHRCLAEVRRQRGELDEAEAVCVKAFEVVSKTESRVSRLWLGPLYIGILLESAKTAATAGKVEESEAKRAKAKELVARYQKLVDTCQSPGFSREAARLATLVA
ncbi:MAG TPA: protein kinase [Pyrinomonadaceae bacterium]|nr:protein kinase [Pyrinomonadaceae bacterium]